MDFCIMTLPRTRSAWLSTFLNFDGQLCLHEPLHECESLAQLEVMGRNAGRFGIVDGTAALVHLAIKDYFPHCRLVLIESDPLASMDSLHKVFPHMDRHRIEESVLFLFRQFDTIKNSFEVEVIDNRNLFTPDGLMILMDAIGMSTVFPADWFDFLDGMNIQRNDLDDIRTGRIRPSLKLYQNHMDSSLR